MICITVAMAATTNALAQSVIDDSSKRIEAGYVESAIEAVAQGLDDPKPAQLRNLSYAMTGRAGVVICGEVSADGSGEFKPFFFDASRKKAFIRGIREGIPDDIGRAMELLGCLDNTGRFIRRR